MKTEKQKRNRYARPGADSEERLGINFSKSEIYQRILLHAYTLRYVTMPVLAAMVYADRQLGILPESKGPTGGLNVRGLQLPVRKLWQHGYLEKRFQPIKGFQSHEENNILYTPDVYILGAKGVQYIAQELGVPASSLKVPQLPRTDKAHGGAPEGDFSRMTHNRLISEVLAGFYALAAIYKDSYELLSLSHDRMFKFEYQGNGGRRAIIPDGVVVMKGKESGKVANFFIEVDRNTEAMNKFSHKLRSYGDLKVGEDKVYDVFREYYDQVNQDLESPIEHQHGNNWRVLTFTTNARHKDYLAQATAQHFEQESPDKRGVARQFYFADLSPFAFYRREEVVSKTSGKPRKEQFLDFTPLNKLGEKIFQVPFKNSPQALFKL